METRQKPRKAASRRKILETSALEINPSTGEPYLYKEPGSDDYFAAYTHMPQLKDCRGKIVLEPANDAFVRQVGGFTLYNAQTKFGYDYQDRLDYKDLAPDMVANAILQYNDLNGDGSVKLPSSADESCDHLRIQLRAACRHRCRRLLRMVLCQGRRAAYRHRASMPDRKHQEKNFTGHSLTLEGDIGVNFYVDLTAEEAANATVSFTWMKNGEQNTASVDLKDAAHYSCGYKAACYVSASDMDADITATITINGVQLDVTDTGTFTYSPMTYCYKAQTSSNVKLVNTVKAIYNYRLAAERFFV